MEPIAVEVVAELRQIKSMADGTYNVIFNFGEDQLEQAKLLMGWVRDQVRAVIVNESKEPDSRKKNRNDR
jgi:hypothetical protein